MRAFLVILLVYSISCFHEHGHSNQKPQMHNAKMAQDIKEHDFNNDSRLDGLEILSAIKHSDFANELRVDTKKMDMHKMREAFDIEIKYYTDIIDEILKEDDFNNDGYLSYIEYSLARRRDEIEEEKERIKKSKARG